MSITNTMLRRLIAYARYYPVDEQHVREMSEELLYRREQAMEMCFERVRLENRIAELEQQLTGPPRPDFRRPRERAKARG